MTSRRNDERSGIRARQLRRLAASLLVVASLPLASSAAPRKVGAGPSMEIQPEEHDFGNVHRNEKLLYAFTILNTGTEDLVIHRISTSCGCTAALAADRVVPPGGTTKLDVTLETRKYSGVVQRSVSVASNDPNRVRTVRVRAFVEPEDD